MAVPSLVTTSKGLDPNHDQTVQSELPVITPDEESDIRRYLKQQSLQVSQIHLLEGMLRSRLDEIDNENIRAMFSDEIAAHSLSNDLSKVQENAIGMGKWLRHHDRQLNRMRVGISQIENRNRLLDLQERNHAVLADTLQKILDDLTLDTDILNELTSPSILVSSSSLPAFKKTVAAAQALNALLQRRFLNGLENLQAVREKRSDMELIRQKFCAQLTTFFSNIFQSESKRLSASPPTSPETPLPDIDKMHASLAKYEDLAAVLESIDQDAFVALRQYYIKHLQPSYSAHVSAFFQWQKKLILKEKRDSGLNSMPAIVDPGTPIAKGALSRSANKGSSKRIITAVFESALDQVLPILLAEHEFSSDYFGIKQPKEPQDGRPVNTDEIILLNESNTTDMMKMLFKGLEEEFVVLADKGDEMDHLYSLKMLVKVESLQHQYNHSCPFAESMLSHLKNRIQVLFEEFTKEQLAWIEGIKVSAKRCGILAPFARLPVFVERMETAAMSGLSRSAIVDKAYTRIIDCMITWLPQIAHQEPKYTTLVMMENAHFFWKFMSNLSIPCMSVYSRKAYDMYKEHLDLYVAWSVKYAFPKVFEFFELLENTAQNLSSIRDVPFTPGLSKQDLRTMVQTHLVKKKVQKAISAMLQRLVKHLGEQGALLPYVWTCMNEYFVASFSKFESLVSKCYQSEEIELTVEDINAAFSSGQGEVLLEALSESGASRTMVP